MTYKVLPAKIRTILFPEFVQTHLENGTLTLNDLTNVETLRAQLTLLEFSKLVVLNTKGVSEHIHDNLPLVAELMDYYVSCNNTDGDSIFKNETPRADLVDAVKKHVRLPDGLKDNDLALFDDGASRDEYLGYVELLQKCYLPIVTTGMVNDVHICVVGAFTVANEESPTIEATIEELSKSLIGIVPQSALATHPLMRLCIKASIEF